GCGAHRHGRRERRGGEGVGKEATSNHGSPRCPECCFSVSGLTEQTWSARRVFDASFATGHVDLTRRDDDACVDDRLTDGAPSGVPTALPRHSERPVSRARPSLLYDADHVNGTAVDTRASSTVAQDCRRQQHWALREGCSSNLCVRTEPLRRLVRPPATVVLTTDVKSVPRPVRARASPLARLTTTPISPTDDHPDQKRRCSPRPLSPRRETCCARSACPAAARRCCISMVWDATAPRAGPGSPYCAVDPP